MRALWLKCLLNVTLVGVPLVTAAMLLTLYFQLSLVVVPNPKSNIHDFLLKKESDQYTVKENGSVIPKGRIKSPRALLNLTLSNQSNNFGSISYTIAKSTDPSTAPSSLFDIVDFMAPITRQHDDFQCLKTSTIPPFTICVYTIQKDMYISESLLSFGVWETHVTNLLVKTLEYYPNATFVDIGANVGYFSLLAATKGHNVIAVEPADEHIDRFHKAVWVDELWNKIILLKNAISDTHTFVVMTKSADNQGNLYPRMPGQNSTRKDTVKTITLNDIATFIETKTAVLKIDIEGFECRAFQNFLQFYRKAFVPYIFMEWMFHVHFGKVNSRCNEKEVNNMKMFLVAIGYRPFNAQLPYVIPLDPSVNFTARLQTPDVVWIHERAIMLHNS